MQLVWIVLSHLGNICNCRHTFCWPSILYNQHRYFMHSYDSPLQHLDKQKKTPLYLYLLIVCIYAWVWIVVCAQRHMFLSSLCMCNCVYLLQYIQYVSVGFHVCVLTPMVRKGRKRQKENRTQWSVECAWFGDYIGPCAWENTKGSVCSQTDERLGKCLASAPSDFNSSFLSHLKHC